MYDEGTPSRTGQLLGDSPLGAQLSENGQRLMTKFLFIKQRLQGLICTSDQFQVDM